MAGQRAESIARGSLLQGLSGAEAVPRPPMMERPSVAHRAAPGTRSEDRCVDGIVRCNVARAEQVLRRVGREFGWRSTLWA